VRETPTNIVRDTYNILCLGDELGRARIPAGFGRDLARLLRNGVGVHHAGVLPKYKEVVERLFLAKLIPPAALAYILFPADILPDVVLGLGQLDDIAALLIGIKLFSFLVPIYVWKGSQRAFKFSSSIFCKLLYKMRLIRSELTYCREFCYCSCPCLQDVFYIVYFFWRQASYYLYIWKGFSCLSYPP